MVRSRCKVCKFLKETKKYNMGSVNFWNRKAREGSTLKELRILLESMGMDKVASKDTIDRHKKECMDLEKPHLLRRITGKTKKFKRQFRFFIDPKKALPTDCEHKQTVEFFDIFNEKICVKCQKCSKILGSYSPEQYDRKMEQKWRKLARIMA